MTRMTKARFDRKSRDKHMRDILTEACRTLGGDVSFRVCELSAPPGKEYRIAAQMHWGDYIACRVQAAESEPAEHHLYRVTEMLDAVFSTLFHMPQLPPGGIAPEEQLTTGN